MINVGPRSTFKIRIVLVFIRMVADVAKGSDTLDRLSNFNEVFGGLRRSQRIIHLKHGGKNVASKESYVALRVEGMPELAYIARGHEHVPTVLGLMR
jgi:hypothetical protein